MGIARVVLKVAAFTLVCVCLSACGGGPAQPSPDQIAVSVSPATAALNAGASQSFTATVTNDATNSGVSWSLGSGTGTLSEQSPSSVTYNAPSSLPTGSTVTLTATSIKDSTKSASATITFNAIAVSVSPAMPAAMAGGGTQSFTATVLNDGAAHPGVMWSATPGTGSFSAITTASGTATVFTAASPVAAASTVITATSNTDPTKSASVTVPLILVSVTISTMPVPMAGGATQALSATVSNDPTNGGVVWSVISGGGSFNPAQTASGASTTYTAASLLTGQAATLKATSVANPNASATVTVPLLPISVAGVSPPGATLGGSQTQAFTVTVNNDLSNSGVTWSIGSGVGILSAVTSQSVIYTAPGLVAATTTVTLTATSVKDPTKTATATITVNPISVSIVPTAPSTMDSGATQTFSASVANDGSNSGVKWSIVNGGGSFSPVTTASGANTTYTAANPVAASSATLMATSIKDPTKSATVTVPLQSIAVAITSAASVAIDSGQQWTVTASITGDPSTSGATFSATLGSFIPATAPGNTPQSTFKATLPSSSAASSTVTVTSVADTSKSATQTITVNPAMSFATSPGALAAATDGTAYTGASVAASGGTGTKSYSIASGALPAGLQLNAATGAITGTPTAAGNASFIVSVADQSNNPSPLTGSFTIDVASPGLSIVTTSLPSAEVGVAYTQTLTANGGSGHGYTWSYAAGAASLPGVGLSLSNAGVVSGTPNAAGSVSFTAKVTDSAGNSATASFTFVVYSAIIITNAGILNLTVGTPVSFQLTATGGSGSGYIYSAVSNRDLTDLGLTLSSTGLLSGTPKAFTDPSFTNVFNVQVTDSAGDTGSGELVFFLTTPAPTITITPTSIPAAVMGTPYTATFAASGGSGSYSWSIGTGLSGLQSIGLSFSAAGVLSGTPTAAGSYSFTVEVTDTGTRAYASGQFTLTVTDPYTSCTHDGSGNAVLSGNYAFLLTGFNPSGHFYDTIGDFHADGAGNITAGNGDVNGDANISLFASGEAQYTFSGTYSIGSSDLRGTATLHNANSAATGLPATSSYCFVAGAIVNGIAQNGHLVESDASGFVLTGSFALQGASAFTDTLVGNSYAFGVQGFSGTTPDRTAWAGQFTLNGSGGVTSGVFDTSAAVYNGSQYVNAYTAQNAVTASGSSYAVNSSGRGSLTLNTASSPQLFIFYPYANGSQMYLMAANAAGTSPLLAGTVSQQTSFNFTASAIEDSLSIVATQGTSNPNTPPLVEQDTAGTNIFIPSSATSTGYVTAPVVTSGLGSQAFLYYYAPGAAYGLDNSVGVDAFRVLPVGSPFLYPSNGWGMGTLSPTAYSGSASSGAPSVFIAAADFSSSTVLLTTDEVTAPGLAASTALDQTFDDPWEATTNSPEFTITTPFGNIAAAQVSATQFFAVETDSTTASSVLIEGDAQSAPALEVYNTSLPYGTVGIAYSQQLSATGGTGTGYTWSSTAGDQLAAASLSLSPTGLISGTPTVPGDYPVAAQVTDSIGDIAQFYAGVLIVPASTGPLTIVTTTLPEATVGQYYDTIIQITGGSGYYAYAITNGAATLQSAGLLASSGTVLGTPTEPGTYSFTLQVTDRYTNAVATASFTLTVVSGVPQTLGNQITLVNSCSSSSTLPAISVTIANSGFSQTATAANGSFSFSSVPPGTYTVTPSITGPSAIFSPASQSIDVTTSGAPPILFGVALGYTVTGTVTYSGTQTGPIYISLKNNNCSGSGAGTTIFAPGSFTIRGVPPGNYTLQAWMDPLGFGAQNAISPTGNNPALSVTTSNVSAIAVTLSDPAPVILSAAPALENVSGFNSGALIQHGAVTDSNGVELATSYILEWSTSSSFTTIAGSKTFTATGAHGPQIWLLNGLSDGSVYYFRAEGAGGTTASGVFSSVYGPVTIGAPNPSGGVTVSGAVTFSGTAAGPLYVGLYDHVSGNFFGQYIPSPSSGVNYSIQVPTGSDYALVGVIDQNNDGIADAGDIQNIGTTTVTSITASATGEDLALPTGNSTVTETTGQTDATVSGTTSTTYSIALQTQYGLKLPVAFTVVAASNPDVIVPSDVGLAQNSGNLQFSTSIGTDVPQPGDTYSLLVTYSDGTTGTLTATVGTIPNFLATNLEPEDSDSVSTMPTFGWTYPLNPSSYTYTFTLSGPNGAIWQIPASGSGFTSAIAPSIAWGVDPTGGGSTPSVSSLTVGTTYTWQIQATDSSGNTATSQVSYVP